MLKLFGIYLITLLFLPLTGLLFYVPFLKILINQVQSLAKDNNIAGLDNDTRAMDEELTIAIANILADNAKLRKQMNSILRQVLQNGIVSRNKDEAKSGKD